MKKVFNKLVRDAIPAIILKDNHHPVLRRVDSDDEFRSLLQAKLREEVEELLTATDRKAFMQEYADVMVVLDALTALDEYTPADVTIAMQENVARKGLFKERVFLESTEPMQGKV